MSFRRVEQSEMTRNLLCYRESAEEIVRNQQVPPAPRFSLRGRNDIGLRVGRLS